MLKIDSFTRSEVGRTDDPFGVTNFLPFDVPLMMRILLFEISDFRFPILYLPAAICYQRWAILNLLSISPAKFLKSSLHIDLMGSGQ
jgi:hypothetical protein